MQKMICEMAMLEKVLEREQPRQLHEENSLRPSYEVLVLLSVYQGS